MESPLIFYLFNSCFVVIQDRPNNPGVYCPADVVHQPRPCLQSLTIYKGLDFMGPERVEFR